MADDVIILFNDSDCVSAAMSVRDTSNLASYIKEEMTHTLDDWIIVSIQLRSAEHFGVLAPNFYTILMYRDAEPLREHWLLNGVDCGSVEELATQLITQLKLDVQTRNEN